MDTSDAISKLQASLDECVEAVKGSSQSHHPRQVYEEKVTVSVQSFLTQIDALKTQLDEEPQTKPISIGKEISLLSAELQSKRELIAKYEAKLKTWRDRVSKLTAENTKVLRKTAVRK
mmetsp:Transcript_12876/g.17793  ORF Transcript_12876/g.17793 Transcript_12876/m.17793 type:complete len:118 (+) Transcript_12876:9-362(+)